MSYPAPVCTTPTFRRQAVALTSRHPELPDYLEALVELLTLQPTQGELLAGTLYQLSLPVHAKEPLLHCVWAVRRNTAFLLLLFDRKNWVPYEEALLAKLSAEGTRLQFET